MIIVTRSEFKRMYGKGYMKAWRILRENYLRMSDSDKVKALEKKLSIIKKG